jgi:hypothetical protein
MITKSEAQKIASKYMEATPGTPILKTNGKSKMFIVPALVKDVQKGEIWIDAETGENLGGAGGVGK